ncbi:hypothetical protein HRbin24_00535 [bacterium HR24]|nr:hypothetical protein HRbin24_00535 [bacterium HR24]
MSLPSLFSSLLPFPIDIPTVDVASPADLSDPAIAEAIAEAVAREAMAQGASPRWAWAYGVLVAEVVTGWAVGPGVEREAAELERAAARLTSPTGLEVPRLYVAPSWEALQAQAEDIAHWLEAAWLEARRRSQEEGVRWLTVREAAAALGVHPEHLRRLVREGVFPAAGVRRIGQGRGMLLLREDMVLARAARGGHRPGLGL